MSIIGMMGAMPRLKGIVTISEERGKWVKGRLVVNPDVSLEISFELGEHSSFCLPGTPITYFGAWTKKGTLFEFELGQVVKIPTSEEYATLIGPVVNALEGYRPMSIAESIDFSRRR